MKNNALSIANTILSLATAEGRQLKHLALMKLVYLAYGHALAENIDDVIDPRFDRVEAWKFGPVIPSVYHSFKYFENKPITDAAVVMDMSSDEPIYTKPVVVDEHLFNIIVKVWNEYKNCSDSQLVSICHAPDTPWAEVYVEGKNVEIPNKKTKDYFEKRSMEFDENYINTLIINATPKWNKTDVDVWLNEIRGNLHGTERCDA